MTREIAQYLLTSRRGNASLQIVKMSVADRKKAAQLLDGLSNPQATTADLLDTSTEETSPETEADVDSLGDISASIVPDVPKESDEGSQQKLPFSFDAWKQPQVKNQAPPVARKAPFSFGSPELAK